LLRILTLRVLLLRILTLRVLLLRVLALRVLLLRILVTCLELVVGFWFATTTSNQNAANGKSTERGKEKGT
jgi:hypothetical protein